MVVQCLNKDTKDKIVIIINDYIKCINDREDYLHHLKEFVPLNTELIPKKTVDKAINFLEITKKNIEEIPICNKIQ